MTRVIRAVVLVVGLVVLAPFALLYALAALWRSRKEER